MESSRSLGPYYEFDEDEIELSRFEVSADALLITIEELSRVQRQKGKRPVIDKNKKKTAKESKITPKPFASALKKDDIFKPDDFKHIDSSVNGKLPSNDTSWQDFAAELTEQCNSDIEKVRAIYYWLGNIPYDLVENNEEETEKDSPLDVIRRAKKENIFSAIFHRLCACAEVPVQLIRGYKKGTHYRLGYQLSESKDRGMWFAVFVADEWRFVDAHWGCGASVGHNDGSWQQIDDSGNLQYLEKSEGKMVYHCNEYYFLTDPEQMIFKHFPDEEDWQLLAKPISKATFEEMPYMRADKLSQLQLQIETHPKGVIEVPDSGEVELKFNEQGEKNNYRALFFIHIKSNAERSDKITFNGKPIDLSRFLMVQRTKSSLSVRVQPPKAGKYLLVFQGSVAESEENHKEDLVHYVLHCPQTKEDIVPMPENVGDSEWGMGAKADTLGVERISEESGEPVTEEGAEVILENGEGNVRLRATQSLDYQCEITGDEMPDNKTSTNVVHWKEESGDDIIHIMAPEEGLFGLSVKAKPRDTGDDFKQVGTFVVEADTNAEEAHLSVPISTMKNNQLGYLDSSVAAELGIEPMTHTDPMIKCYESKLAITWKIPPGTQLNSEFCRAKDGSSIPCDDRLNMDLSKSGECTFDIKFPEMGNYTLKISNNSHPLFLYMIRALGRPDDDQKPFPKTNQSVWSSGYELITPDNALLPAQKDVEIQIRAPDGIKNIALLDHKQKVHLFEKIDDVWGLAFNTGYAGSVGGVLPVKVDRGQGKKPAYEDLLEFKILSGEEIKLLDMKNALNEKEFKEKQKRERIRLKKKKNHELVKSGKPPEPESDLDSDSENTTPAASALSTPTKSFVDMKKEKVRDDKLARDNLEKALKQENRARIQKALKNFESRNIKDRDGIAEYAKEFLEMLELKSNLQDAMKKSQEERKKIHISKAIKKIDQAQLTQNVFNHLKDLITEAQELFKRIDRTERLVVRILELDNKTLLELRNYAKPSEDIHKSVQATLLLLGYYEKRTKKWQRCQPLLKGIISDIKNYNHTEAHPALAARAKVIVKDVIEQEIALKSGAAAAFYNWSTGIIDLIKEDCKPEDFKPATLQQQRKILHISKQEEADLEWEDNGAVKKKKAFLSDSR